MEHFETAVCGGGLKAAYDEHSTTSVTDCSNYILKFWKISFFVMNIGGCIQHGPSAQAGVFLIN